ncbi:hypothetical protein M8J75_011583 [Diaphorina citri]|nr:hypothetical protein M8J75_011583 [Diaphorina citri]KAI5731722.1 hypothetical protein M8J77_015055 [Diaphorina citri]
MKTEIISSVNENIASHSKQLKAIYRKDIKKNLVIHGWRDLTSCSIQNMRQEVLKLLTEKLEITDVRIFDIHNIQLVGPRKNIIIASLCPPELVRMAITNSKKLVGTNIYVRFDLSPEDRKIRKQLLEHKKALTAIGKTCKMRNNALLVDSVLFTLQQLQNGEATDSREKTQNKRQLSISPATPSTPQSKKKTRTIFQKSETKKSELNTTLTRMNLIMKIMIKMMR